MRGAAAIDGTVPNSGVRSFASEISELSKARLSLMALLTTYMGFYLGAPSGFPPIVPLISTLVGAAALAASAGALNQVMERSHDAKMDRTQDRPLVTGALSVRFAVTFGIVLFIFGTLALAFGANLLTCFLGVLTVVSYLFVYTPLKRRTTFNTVVGAIPGALPPMMGWTAATGEMSAAAWALFAILFIWQVPHFMAIAWLYRDDYQKGGFQMLPMVDPDGRRTSGQAILYTVALIEVSIAPSFLGVTGVVYAIGALLVGLVFLRAAIKFGKIRDRSSAKGLFVASIIYLPILLGLMMIDKVK